MQASSLPHIRTQVTVVDGTAALDADAATSNFATTPFSNALDAEYISAENKVLPEVLYFRSGFKSATGTETIKFKVGDLKTNYRIKATVVTANGIGISSRTISVADAFSFTADMPKVMMVGEKYTVTLNAINFTPNDITATPTLTYTNTDDYTIDKDFSYSVKVGNAAPVIKTDYVVTKNSTLSGQTFTITVTKAVPDSTIDLTIKLDGKSSDDKNEFVRTITYPVTFLDIRPMRYNASADELGTRQQINPSFTNSSDFIFMAPDVQAEANEMVFVVNILDSYQTRLTLMINNLLSESYDKIYLNAEEITIRIEMVLSKIVEYTAMQVDLDPISADYKAIE